MKIVAVINDSTGQIQTVLDGYENETPKEQLISEILTANNWFVSISKPMEIIREEVEKQFDMYGKWHNCSGLFEY